MWQDRLVEAAIATTIILAIYDFSGTVKSNKLTWFIRLEVLAMWIALLTNPMFSVRLFRMF